MTLLNSKMLCERWNLSKSLICGLAKQGKIPSYKLAGSGYIFNLDELNEWEQLQRLKIFARYGMRDQALGLATK